MEITQTSKVKLLFLNSFMIGIGAAGMGAGHIAGAETVTTLCPKARQRITMIPLPRSFARWFGV